MDKLPVWSIPLLVLGIAAILYGWIKVQQERSENPFADRQLIKRGMDLPCLWLFYDVSEVNSRWWADFGARSSRALNLPFMNLCYDTIAKYNGNDYRIEVIGGLADLATRLGGWEALPLPLRNAQAQLRSPEMNWIRAAILAKYGGLWLNPAVLCMKPFGKLPEDRVVFFGMDHDQSFAGPAGTKVPSLKAIWSCEPGHPIFVKWAQRAYERLETTNGGRQIRGDDKSDYAELAAGKVEVVPNAELSRKGVNRKPLQLEDLLAAGEQDDLHFKVPCDTIYVPLPWPELKERRMYGWFLRMSEEQILASDLAISTLFRSAL
jgi:hypothetical protein